MNTNHLKTMLSLLKTKSYQKTAAALNYSRSTVMEHIQTLEQELGTKLFLKSGREILPTAAGERFAVRAKDILESYSCALLEAVQPEASSSLRILATETLGVYILPNAFRRMISLHPDISMSIRIGIHNQFSDLLRAGEADIAFGFKGSSWGILSKDEFELVSLHHDPIVFFVNPNHPLAGKTTVSLSDLMKHTLILANKDGIIRQYIDRLCKDYRLSISKQYIDSGTLLKQLVLTQEFVSVISRSVILEELKRGELVELPFREELLYGELIAVFPRSRQNTLRDQFLTIVRHALEQ